MLTHILSSKQHPFWTYAFSAKLITANPATVTCLGNSCGTKFLSCLNRPILCNCKSLCLDTHFNRVKQVLGHILKHLWLTAAVPMTLIRNPVCFYADSVTWLHLSPHRLDDLRWAFHLRHSPSHLLTARKKGTADTVSRYADAAKRGISWKA